MTNHGMALSRICLALMVCVSALWAKDRFLLQSELLTSYSSGTPVKVLTGYSYNDSGFRVDKNAYNGTDTNAPLMSSTVYTYNANNTLAQEVAKSAAGDTVSIVRYGYDAGKHTVAVSTLTKQLTLRYVDSMAYNAGGQMTDKRRYVSGSLSFYHTYSYGVDGKKTADTLHENPGTGFIATQAVLFSYDGTGRAANEKNWLFQSGAWYLTSTNIMAYSPAGSLASVTRYEGDGTSNRMQDSLAYAYDAFANQTRVSDYDDTRTLLSTIDYMWIDTQPTSVARDAREARAAQNAAAEGTFAARFVCGKLFLSNACGATSVSVYDAAGRQVRRSLLARPADHGIFAAVGMRSGKYVAIIRNGNRVSTAFFNVIN